jgi:hypothetical protein
MFTDHFKVDAVYGISEADERGGVEETTSAAASACAIYSV